MTETPVAMACLEMGPRIEKSPLDTRCYRGFTLANRMKVLLVSDPLSGKAAAAMDVLVGSFSDPDEIPGLAHLLEHMLFLGTNKYPEEDSFEKFLSENQGYSNAYTAEESTNYYFQLETTKDKQQNDTHNDTFREALCMFAQFFVAPLLTESATNRELNAVDAEHEMLRQIDMRKLYQVKKSTANRQHPFHKFQTGSKQTLCNDSRAKNIDLRCELFKFYNKYYSANLMNLCVVGPYSLDAMQQWVVELFSVISNRNCSHPSTAYSNIPVLLPNQMGHRSHVVSVMDIRHLNISWPIPSLKKLYRSKPAEHICHLLRHEGKGSLFSLLRRKGWAEYLTSGVDSFETFAFFEVSIGLTSDGVHHVDEIIGLVYDYIYLIKAKGLEEWIFAELAVLAELSFRFIERSKPCDFATSMTVRMSKYPEAEWISGDYLHFDYNPGLVEELLNQLTPARGTIAVAGKFVDGSGNMMEVWYGTSYRLEAVSEDKKKSWSLERSNPELGIPEKNVFIPESLDLLAEPLHPSEVDTDGPVKVLESKHLELHYKLDRTFRRPKASIVMKLICPSSAQNPLNYILTTIFTLLVEDALQEYVYDASLAGLGYSLSLNFSGMELTVTGYNDRMHILATAVLEQIANLSVDSDRFEKIRDQVERSYSNLEKEQPTDTRRLSCHCFLKQRPGNGMRFLPVYEMVVSLLNLWKHLFPT
jgi:insulysin